MLQLSRLNLEMARDNNAPIDYLEMLENKLLVWEDIEKQLTQEGEDPNTFLIEFSFKVEEKSKM